MDYSNTSIANTTPSSTLLAATNGFAASLSCLARSLGPGISGIMFRLGIEMGYVALPFWMLSIWATFGAIGSWWLRDYP
jgi:hypothetical protein